MEGREKMVCSWGHAGLRRLGMSKRILVTCSKKQSGLETHFLGGC